jgi:RNA polymerase sigma-70 factor, ECF subfamily
MSGAVEHWQGFEAFYTRHSAAVYRRALKLLGDKEAARDATQEVFVRALRGSAKVPSLPTPTAWLYRVTTNLCLNRLRDQRRAKDLLSGSGTPDISIPATAETRAMVAEILGRVPEELQDIAVYFFLDELTYEEIAPLVGVSRRTIGNRLAAFRELVGRIFPDARLAS